jgi:hypothetical protein
MVPPVFCLNGHDSTGVEGFTCRDCGAEVRTLLVSPPVAPVRPERLLMLTVGLLVLFAGLVAARPRDLDATGGAVLATVSLVGVALWLAGCVCVAVAISRQRGR